MLIQTSTRAEEQAIKDAMAAAMNAKMETSATGSLHIPRTEILNYKLIPTSGLPDARKPLAHKVNSLIDMFYFATVTLGRTRLQRGPDYQYKLHYQMCLTVMKDGLKEVIEIPRDHFKALAFDTLIPTPQGFKKIKDIHPGDFVFGKDGLPTEVIGESPIFNSNKCFDVTFSTGEVITADAGHKWTVDERRRAANDTYYSGPFVKTTEEMSKDFIYKTRIEPTTGNVYKEANYKIEAASAVAYEEKDLLIHPYALGCWLGDGASQGAKFTSADPDIINVLREIGIKVTVHAAKYSYGFVDGFDRKLKTLDLVFDKHIPQIYLQGSIEQRWDLLCGLMDTDGSVNKEGQCNFTNTNYKLMTQVHELAASLGLKPSPIGTYRAFLGKKEKDCGDFFILTFYPNDRVPFYLPRKQDRCRERKRGEYRQIVDIQEVASVPVKCISVAAKDSLFLVGKSFIPTHNSEIYSVIFPMWRALPFGPKEEDLFTRLKYSDLFIEWMKRTHSQDIRILVVSETIKNAIKLGTRTSNHYVNGKMFRELFPEILPTSGETWTADSLHQKRTPAGAGQGEGTFDFIGVGAALQSRHYNLIIQDDLVGKDAIQAESVMQSTIEYHQLLVGATDSDPNNPNRDFDEIVVGNRWSHKDLNSYIRDNEPYFGFTTHAALGGCCNLHPFGAPIFPEEMGMNKLLQWKRRLGTYFFTCQFLNSPIDPSKAKFNMKDFRYFHFENTTGVLTSPKGGYSKLDTIHKVENGRPQQVRTVIRHHVVDGDVEKDVFPRHLDRYMIVDPNHSGQHKTLGGGRCRHAIIVSGVQRDPRRVYLLETWAKAALIGDFITQMFKMAIKWKITTIHVEAVAAQKYLLYHLEYFINEHRLDMPEIANIKIEPLKTPQSANSKFERIDNTIPIVERGEVWLDSRASQDFRDEAEAYGQKKGLIDLLDVFGYGPQVWKFDTISEDEVNSFLSARLAKYKRGIASVA